MIHILAFASTKYNATECGRTEGDPQPSPTEFESNMVSCQSTLRRVSRASFGTYLGVANGLVPPHDGKSRMSRDSPLMY